MNALLDVVACASAGMMVGVELAVAAFVDPIVWRMEDREQAFAVRGFAARFGAAMPFWYAANLLLLIAEAWVRRQGENASLLWAAVAIWALVIVMTLVFLVPINNRLAKMSVEELSATAKEEHRRWDGRHRLRVVALGVSLVLLLVVVA